jgi:hypothetical protein
MMMDESTKERFKWKFYKLAVMLNIIVILIAVGFVALFKAPQGFAIPIALIFFILAAILGYYFRKGYKTIKAWLDANA